MNVCCTVETKPDDWALPVPPVPCDWLKSELVKLEKVWFEFEVNCPANVLPPEPPPTASLEPVFRAVSATAFEESGEDAGGLDVSDIWLNALGWILPV